MRADEPRHPASSIAWRLAVAVAFALLFLACDEGSSSDDSSSAPVTARVTGPFSELPEAVRSPDGCDGLGSPRSEIGPRDEAHFCLVVPPDEGTARAVLKAQAAPPLELGAVIHRASLPATDGRARGLSLHPRSFNEGGARRDDKGRPAWVAGVYQLEVTDASGAPLADTVFHVARR
jgi:hypothetical protein